MGTHIFQSTTRRRFLRGAAIGGGSILSGLMHRLAHAAPGDPVRRCVVVSLGHSLDPITNAGATQWLPPNSPSGLGDLPEFLSPLAPFKPYMAALQGVDNLVARMVGSNGHNASSRTLLNCQPHAEYNGPGSVLDWRSTGGGPSIEYVLGERLGIPPLVLRSGVTNGEHRRTFLADGSDDEGNPDPVSAFANLFAGASNSAGGLSPAELLSARRRDILQSVRGTYEVTAQRAGSADRARLQAHASLIDNFINEIEFVPPSTCSPAPPLSVPADYPNTFTDEAGRSDHLMAPLHNSLITTAFSCNATRVASLHYSTMQTNQFPFINDGADLLAPYGVGWHGFCHHDAGTPDSVRVRAQTWYSAMLADLLDKLQRTPDGDGTLLDNTIVILTSSLGSAFHDTDNIPFLVFGGINSGLITNQVVYEENGRRTTGDVWTTLLQLMGQTDDGFGRTGQIDGRNFNNGPISALMT